MRGLRQDDRSEAMSSNRSLAGIAALIASATHRAGAGLPARRSRQGLLRPQRRPGRGPAGRSEAGRQSLDADLRLHADRGPGGLSEGVGRLHQAPGKGHRQARGVLPGAVERRAIRGDALRPPARRGRQRRRQRDRGELRGLRAVRDDGGEGQQLRLRDGNHRAGRQPDQDAGRSQGQEDRVHRRRPRTPASRRRRRSSRPTSSSRPSATTSRCSPASTTTRSSAWSTRTTRRRRSPIRCSTG